MNKVAVIGGGQMGRGIAQVFAAAGKDVIIYDIKQEFVDGAKANLQKGLDKMVARGKMEQAAADAIMGRISYSIDPDYADIGDTDLVVEAAVENMNIKKAVFKKLDAAAKPECILSTNTSSLSITEVASAVARKDKVIGMHFFNPPVAMKLIEIIRGGNTSDEVYEAVFEASKEIGKTPVTVNEAPGFVVNRILIPMINEGIEVVASGVASAEDVDTAMKLGANHPMGPLTLGDFIGLDTCLAIMETIYSETGDPKYRPSLLLRKMVRAGKLGNKTGEGFFKH
ncbi:MAG: 3-hydroxybutyryl-CoA dehydrogenase [Oscillospiraceae bacterium]|nr:3-hydroxybutyryl-CoA dehydrogenase [Oscillospiraceae bacterium]MBQ2633952.1 3-hydroxybutyryl-CoA dehydrogenase [Oscillospiraceae bacterium]MBR3084708.1 3-hydroxybutyryl-CoA dehydrogenase [Oscillospiraceae bacterium]MBR3861444.1 3-hydroxybutyryl-CoA dehydrogenase [Oscillospiraceae bacterium]MBR6096181.1 3-hydroxybutyryl-CoA dehydrogenase [Oscillospiraceae bacterium]